jgi:hypothetical protein
MIRTQGLPVGHGTLRLPQSRFHTLAPSIQILDNRNASRGTHDDPDSLFVSIVDLPMLSICRNERPVSWVQILPDIAKLGPVILPRAGRGRHERAVAAHSVDDGVLASVMVDCRRRVRLRAHQSAAQRRRNVNDGGLFRLAKNIMGQWQTC